MIEETATVVSCEGDLAEVATERPTACGSCAARQGCGTALLARVFGNRNATLRVANPIHAQPGERVVIGVPEAGLVLASLLLYLVPLLGLISFAVVAQLIWGPPGTSPSGEWPGIVAGIIGLLAGLLAARRLGRREQSMSRSRPVILRRRRFADIEVVRGTRNPST